MSLSLETIKFADESNHKLFIAHLLNISNC